MPAPHVVGRYVYRGDRLTDARYRGQWCEAVRKPNGRCVRGRNANMLVRFADGQRVVVSGRHLRTVLEDAGGVEVAAAMSPRLSGVDGGDRG